MIYLSHVKTNNKPVKTLKRTAWILSTSLTYFCPAYADDALYTDSVLYQAFAEAPLQTPLTTVAKTRGQCKQNSTVSERDDAWRCQVEGGVLDPCYVRRYSKRDELVCPLSPWSDKAVQVTINHLLLTQRPALDMAASNPWSVELTNGKRCIKLPPEERNLEGETERYRCEDGVALVGDFYRCKGLWEIYSKDNGNINTVYIKRAWY